MKRSRTSEDETNREERSRGRARRDEVRDERREYRESRERSRSGERRVERRIERRVSRESWKRSRSGERRVERSQGSDTRRSWYPERRRFTLNLQSESRRLSPSHISSVSRYEGK